MKKERKKVLKILMDTMKQTGMMGMLVMLTTLTGSCSDEGTVLPEPPSTAAISLGADVGEATTVTRAVQTGLHTYTGTFRVTGYKYTDTDGLQDVMTDYSVKWEGTPSGGCWNYVDNTLDQGTKYWDFASRYYRFTAYVPQRPVPTYRYNVQSETVQQNGHNVVEVSFTGLSSLKIYNDSTTHQEICRTIASGDTVSMQDLPLASDLWHGTVENLWNETADTIETVRLNFRIPFSKVRVMFMRSGDSKLTARKATVTDVTFSPVITSSDQHAVATEGGIGITYPLDLSDTIVTTSTTISATSEGLTFDNLTRADDENESITVGILDEIGRPYPASPEYLLLPRIGEGTPFRLTATINGKEQTCIVPAEYMEWQPGYEYTYIFKILSGADDDDDDDDDTDVEFDVEEGTEGTIEAKMFDAWEGEFRRSHLRLR